MESNGSKQNRREAQAEAKDLPLTKTDGEQLFDDLIDKALSHDFKNRMVNHNDTIVVAKRRSGFLREVQPSVRAKK